VLLALSFNENFQYDRRRIELKGKQLTFAEWRAFCKEMGPVSEETIEIGFLHLLKNNDITHMVEVQFDKVASIKQQGLILWEPIESCSYAEFTDHQRDIFNAYQQMQK